MPRDGVGFVTLAASALILSGCGTVANTVWFIPEEGGQRIFGGVRADWEVLQEAATTRTGSSDRGDRQRVIVSTALDLPFSAIGDTLTLPVTIPCTILRSPGRQTTSPDGSEPPGEPTVPARGAGQ